ncbi:hypothetical protein YPPY56_4798, partial [Yersinia pestis PY-56]
MWLASL